MTPVWIGSSSGRASGGSLRRDLARGTGWIRSRMDSEWPSSDRHPLRTTGLSLLLRHRRHFAAERWGRRARHDQDIRIAVWGNDAFAGISVGGHTDRFLLSNALVRANLLDHLDLHARFRAACLPGAGAGDSIVGSGRYGLMPGIDQVLAAVREREGFTSRCSQATMNRPRGSSSPTSDSPITSVEARSAKSRRVAMTWVASR